MGSLLWSAFAFLAVSSLASRSLGFSLENVGLVNLADTGIRQSTERTPTDAYVDYYLQVYDTNNDGEVALTELRQMLYRYFEAANYDWTAARFRAQVVGPAMAIERLIDADDSGTLDRNELERYADLAVEEAGSPVALAALTLRTDHVRRMIENESSTSNDGFVTTITNALDSNDDGAISNEELTALEDTQWFRGKYDMMDRLAKQADQDGNNSLNGAEIRGWLELLDDEYARYVSRLFRFGTVADRIGRDLAMQMINI